MVVILSVVALVCMSGFILCKAASDPEMPTSGPAAYHK